MKILLITIILLSLFSYFIASAEEEMTDGDLTLKLSEDMATFSYSWETDMSATVEKSSYYSCLEVCCCDYEECKLACYTLTK